MNKLAFSRDGVLGLFLVVVILASGGDLLADLNQGVDTSHILQEAIVLTVAIATLGWLLLGIRRQRLEIANLREALASAREQLPTATPEVMAARKQLSEVIASQFGQWQLTASEKEVGLLLLKGLSLKEIAGLRGTTEKTVRQQASNIYQKAALPGRHAFAAWFIEDFL